MNGERYIPSRTDKIKILCELENQNIELLDLLKKCHNELKEFDINENKSFNIFVSRKSNENRNFIGIRISAKYFAEKFIWDKYNEYFESVKEFCYPEKCYKDYIFFNIAKEETQKHLWSVANINQFKEYKYITFHYKHLPNSNADTLMQHISKFIIDNYADMLNNIDVNWHIQNDNFNKDE